MNDTISSEAVSSPNAPDDALELGRVKPMASILLTATTMCCKRSRPASAVWRLVSQKCNAFLREVEAGDIDQYPQLAAAL